MISLVIWCSEIIMTVISPIFACGIAGQRNRCFCCWRFKTTQQPQPPQTNQSFIYRENSFIFQCFLHRKTWSSRRKILYEREERENLLPFLAPAPGYFFLGDIFVRIAKELENFPSGGEKL